MLIKIILSFAGMIWRMNSLFVIRYLTFTQIHPRFFSLTTSTSYDSGIYMPQKSFGDDIWREWCWKGRLNAVNLVHLIWPINEETCLFRNSKWRSLPRYHTWNHFCMNHLFDSSKFLKVSIVYARNMCVVEVSAFDLARRLQKWLLPYIDSVSFHMGDDAMWKMSYFIPWSCSYLHCYHFYTETTIFSI